MRKNIPVKIILRGPAAANHSLSNSLIEAAKSQGFDVDALYDTLPGILPVEREIQFRKSYKVEPELTGEGA